jgi:phenylalanyl-tRNA synthetase alpha chain
VRENLERLERDVEQALTEASTDTSAVDAVRIRFLGKKGELTGLLKQLKTLPPEEKKEAGREINRLKASVESRIEAALARAREAALDAQIERDRVDVTLPSRRSWHGSLHPVTQTRRELESIFRELGFSVESGPEVEDDFHNFQALNMPPDHPARDATDTFYLAAARVLRTHTSPVQIRVMERRQPPIKMVCPGRVYRRDFDATHLPMFHQLEALVVGEGVTMADLKGTLDTVWKRFFGEGAEMRLRPGYFPFVEPGCEYDCRIGDGPWLELGGAGMVHPHVLRSVGLDPQVVAGFAFGLGIDRIAMMRFGIDDLRLLMENDVRFLAQFPG